MVSKISQLWILGNCLSMQQTNWMFGTEMAILEDQSLDFDSSDQTLDRNPRNLKIYLIQLTFTICCWPLWPPFFFSSFLFFFSGWKFLFFSSACIWITELKPTLPLEYLSLWDFYADWVLLIAFIFTRKVCSPKFCEPFFHFIINLCLSELEKEIQGYFGALSDCITTAMRAVLLVFCFLFLTIVKVFD